MNTARIWLLLLLAVLLPVRGAVAAAMLCPVAGTGVHMELAGGIHSAGHVAMDEAMSHAHAGGHDHSLEHDHAAPTPGDEQPGHDHAGSEACNACSAYCSLTPLVSDAPALAEPLDPTSVKFSDVSAPPASFDSDGQERPPRTI